MDTYLFVLGRNAELSMEELLIVLEPLGHIVEVNPHAVIFRGAIDSVELLSRLGGTVKIGKVVHEINQVNDLTQDLWLHTLRPELTTNRGRFTFGASYYGHDNKAREHIRAVGLLLKKHLRAMPLSVRFVSNAEGMLSSVAVRKNHLLGRELLLVEGKKLYVALTQTVQDFDLYSRRDYGRPFRNPARGMLPPKLAQIMLNLAQVSKTDKLLDPFCGGGTIVQEALLFGITHVWGSDKDPRAIAEAKNNLEWLRKTFDVPQAALAVRDIYELEKGYEAGFFDVIVTEPYLGPAKLLSRPRLTRAELGSVINELTQLYAAFFREIRTITSPQARLVVILPIFKFFGEDHYVGSLDVFERLGWRLVRPRVPDAYPQARLSARGQHIYSREDQIVAREITVWQKAGQT